MNQKGYALIEIIFLVAVIAILSKIILPNINESMKVAKSNYLMKTLYSEIRFNQSLTRISDFNKDQVFENTAQIYSPHVVYHNEDNFFVNRVTGKNSDLQKFLRKYYLDKNFSFETEFNMSYNSKGTLNNSLPKNSNSGHISLRYNNLDCKPFIIFNSVGRLRLSQIKNSS